MAHFAQLDDNNIVIKVIVVDNDDCKRKEFWDPLGIFTGKEESEEVGIAFCKSLCGHDTLWKQTSYNANFRGNFAGIGMTYMPDVQTLGVASTDIFIGMDPPAESWSIGLHTANHVPPGPPGYAPEMTDEEYKASGRGWYEWNEENYKKDPSTAWVFTKE